jgi:TonB family protein
MMTSQRIRRIARTVTAAVLAAVMAGVALERPALAQGAVAGPIELPPYKGTLRDDYYPAEERLHYLQGRALVEFAVDARGVPTDVVVVSSEPERRFEESAHRLVKNLRFSAPAGWEQTGAGHRFKIGVRFQVIQCLNLSRCETQPRNPPADYEAANRTYVVSTQQRVVAFARQLPDPPATPNATAPAPAPASSSSAPPAPPAAAPSALPPRPRASPNAAPEEPIYPPG